MNVTTTHESQPKTAQANGLTIAYETFGDPSARPLLLVMGLATQMLAWHEDFCGSLVQRGFFVIRFDNRDIGLSTHLTEDGMPDLGGLFSEPAAVAPYRLEDMADDAVGLLDALDIASAD